MFINDEGEPDGALNDRYSTLSKYSDPLKAASRKIVGREFEISQLAAAMRRPELSNVILLAEAGTGKTSLVQGAMLIDKERSYREVDLARMIAELKNPDEMAARLKALFDDAEKYTATEGHELVLFIDEIHQVVQLSAAAVEALKPVLAASGARGLRVIAATTYEEFHQHIAPNQPLMERLQRINVAPPNRQVTIEILRGMADRYGVGEEFYDDHMFELIYEYTNRYIPASSQPRKSILVLDGMVGWHREKNRPMDRDLLADVLMESTNVNIAFRVDAVRIKEQLDSKVLSQDLATSVVAKRLQLCVADLNDKSKPMSSFLLTGGTGVGKGTCLNEWIPVYTEDGNVTWKQAGQLVSGDYVFDASGVPEKVLGVFPQAKQDVYRVTLSDGRSLVTDGPHLWGVYPSVRDRDRGLTVLSTETLALRLNEASGRTTRKLRYSIPMNQAVQWPEADLPVAPYALGAIIADGALTPTLKILTLTSDDEFIVAKVGGLIGAEGYDRQSQVRTRADGTRRPSNYNWVFRSGRRARRGVARVQKADVIGTLPEVTDQYSADRRIPKQYLTASVEQRWELVRGLFDSDGHIGGKDGGRYNVSYSTSSGDLADDVRHLLYSLGVMASVRFSDRDNGQGSVSREYTVHVRSQQAEKFRFFSLPRKLEIAERAAEVVQTKPFDTEYVDIVSVEKLDEQEETVCIYVDHPDHLYQAGEFIVTHNTELTKQLAKLLFGDDQRHLIRFDMSEFALDTSLTTFRSELTRAVWDMGHAVLLFDEIEKASQLVTRVLLQVLDDGRLSDDNGRQVSFLNTYIVLTTNAGSEIYESIAHYNVDDTGSGRQLVDKMKEIKRSISTTQGDNKFPPELLGRINAIVPFQPLSRETQRNIVKNKLASMRQEVMTKHNVKVAIHPRVLKYLIDDNIDTDSSAGGARAAIAKMDDEVTTEVAAFLNAHPNERNLRVDVVGTMRNEDKNMRVSESYIEVAAYR